eukprot:12054952-Ditylum_brightwellii.AAC.1
MMMSMNRKKAAYDTVLPATSLPWDDSSDSFEKALEMAKAIKMEEGPGWKRAGKEKGQKWAKRETLQA